MRKLEQLNNSENTLDADKLDMRLKEIIESNPEVAEVVEEYDDLAIMFGKLCLARGYEEATLPDIIARLSRSALDWEESLNQGADREAIPVDNLEDTSHTIK